jgi:anaerobic C4-dicarboxylate transporter
VNANTTKLANALALATAILWALCSAVVWLLPEFSLQVTSWWMHGMDLSAMGNWDLTFSNFLLGGVTAVISAWIAGWVLGWSWQVIGRNNKR